ncbi:MAG: SPFH domain-containing protein, partial [Lentisphaeria bacterium]
GVDLILGVVVDYYHANREGENRSPFEPRIFSVLLQPGDIAENIAALLNYQFGFKVSNSWFFKVLGKVIMPMIIFTVVVAWLMSAIVFIESDSHGIIERFGKVDRNSLSPGVYLKMPYPFAKVLKYQVKRVQSFMLGDDDEQLEPEVIVWTQEHSESEEKYLLPNRLAGSDGSVAVSYLMVNIPLRYTIKDLYGYVYNFVNADKTLRQLAKREVLTFLARSEFFNFFTTGRFAASEELKDLIQKKADALGLGVNIEYVNFMAVHPPFEVGEAFESVASAMELKSKIIADAESYENEKLAESSGKVERLLFDALAHSVKVKILAQSEAKQFLSQLTGYEIFSGYYELNNLLNIYSEQEVNRRKYILPSGLKSEKYILNLEEKQGPDLLDLGN